MTEELKEENHVEEIVTEETKPEEVLPAEDNKPAEEVKEPSIWQKFKALIIGAGTVGVMTVGYITIGNNPDSAKSHDGMTIYALNPLDKRDTLWFETVEACSSKVAQLNDRYLKCEDIVVKPAKTSMIEVEGVQVEKVEPAEVQYPIKRIPVKTYLEDASAVTILVMYDDSIVGKCEYTNTAKCEEGYKLAVIPKIQIIPVRQ